MRAQGEAHRVLLKREGAGDILAVYGGVIPPKEYAS